MHKPEEKSQQAKAEERAQQAKAEERAQQAKVREDFLQRYDVQRVGSFAFDSVVEKARGFTSLGKIAEYIGVNAVLRVLMVHLDDLAEDLGVGVRYRPMDLLHKMARKVLSGYHYLNMPELLLAINKFRKDRFGTFHGRLTMSNLIQGMDAFVAWKRERERYM